MKHQKNLLQQAAPFAVFLFLLVTQLAMTPPAVIATDQADMKTATFVVG